MEIWRDILEAVREADRRVDGVAPSRIQSSANLPHGRFWVHVQEMEARGLVRSEPLQTTPDGERFLAMASDLRTIVDD